MARTIPSGWRVFENLDSPKESESIAKGAPPLTVVEASDAVLERPVNPKRENERLITEICAALTPENIQRLVRGFEQALIAVDNPEESLHDRRLHVSEHLSEQLIAMGKHLGLLEKTYFKGRVLTDESKAYLNNFRDHVVKLHVLIQKAGRLGSDILWANSRQPTRELEHSMEWLKRLDEKIVDVEPRYITASLDSPKARKSPRTQPKSTEGVTR